MREILTFQWGSNIYRVYFIFDIGNVVVLFNGFQKKTEQTPRAEIERAKKIKKQYYEAKNGQ